MTGLKNYPQTSILRIDGPKIVDGDGKEVILRGAVENFITGYPGHEFQFRRALTKILGEDKAKFFFDKFLEYFFSSEDVKFAKSVGFNCLRIPFNYRHFEDDMNPGVYNEEGFKWLDRAIDMCAEQGVYTILDLHTAPGGQNQGWHSDSGNNRALFWQHKEFQDRMIKLWEVLAARYKDNGWVAGYNPLNEPADEEHTRLLKWYERLEKAMHAIDPHHIIFLDGNTFAADLSRFETPLPGCVYACHDYSSFGFPAGQRYKGTDEQKQELVRQFTRKSEYMTKHGLPIWNGEFGPVYANESDGPEWQEINQERFNLLRDQLALYEKARASWSIWLLKDIGFQGMIHTSPNSVWHKRLGEFLAKKKRLAADAWGTDDRHIKHIVGPVEQWLEAEVPSIKTKYPSTWTTNRHVARAIRHTLLSECLMEEFVELFRGLNEQELDKMAASFKFENCMKREGLNRILRENC
ncbi:hypothetical protein HDV00_002282 [Rhizophlyctis rosea]|nr:hypothetical protein HDV00_002282 [Rhizophlyctis rosea]